MAENRYLLHTLLVVIPIALTPSLSLAQSTPSEFAEMSLSELFDESIDENGVGGSDSSPWTLAVQYKMVEFEGYLDGTDDLRFQEVLWNAPGETRTKKNFPVVPTVIRQEASVVTVGYEVNKQWRSHLTIPYIKQTTDHISVVPGYGDFKIKTSGIGDVVVSGSYKFIDTDTSRWWFTMGLSLPTGSIDEEGDTPRSPGNQQLPYTMQLGSGTFDFPMELSYQNLGSHDYSLHFSANIRTGENDRDYRLGNHYSIGGRYKFHPWPTVQPHISLDYQYGDSIHGMDDSLRVESPFPYPASITDPDLYGGHKVGINAGISWEFSRHYRISAELGAPLYQNLNGPQPKEDWRSSLQVSRAL